MADHIEVHIDLNGETERLGTLYRQPGRQGETVTFEYDQGWVGSPQRFSIEPALRVGRGAFAPQAGRAMFGSIGDSAPDTWGRRLMQRKERRQAGQENRTPRSLSEADYLLGVTDISRLGALRFKQPDDDEFQTPLADGVPSVVDLGNLLSVTERILRDEETDEDLQLIFAPGSSLGGARPKASVIDQNGLLAIAKFPKEDDEYSIETWESIALHLAEMAGINVPQHELITVGGKRALLSRRFDRAGLDHRIPFLSAMSMTGLQDGDRGSYPEMADTLAEHGGNVKADVKELYRRMVFNVLISNVDDHLRNHGFLWSGPKGWVLSPAYDLNPVPPDLKPRILSSNIDLDEGTCSLDLVEGSCGYFGLSLDHAHDIIREVAAAVNCWREVAANAGAPPAEINRMAGAFEHDDLERSKSV